MIKNLSVFLAIFFLSLSVSHAQIMFTAALDGSQEAPDPVTTDATGTAWAILDTEMKELTYHITYAQLDSTFTAAHFHLGAAGVPGGVVQPITFNGNTASGTWSSIPDSIIAKLLKEEIYINIHSAKNTSGEIRGQLIPVDGIGFSAMLDGSQETPDPVETDATGTGWATLKNGGTEIEYRVTVAGLSSNLTMAHFHNAAAGEGGGVVQAITFTDSTSSGTWSGFGENIISELVKDRLYFNVHSGNHTNGEIRGQLLQQGEIMFKTVLDGSQEAPDPVTTDGNGTGWAVLSGDRTTLSYHITYAQLDSIFTAAHFHLGAAGVPGGVVHPITFNGNTASGEWSELPDSIIAKLIKEHIYVNVHSAKYTSGEIRGQLENIDGIGFTSGLDGDQETPDPVSTEATGTGWAELTNMASEINYNITVANLSSDLTMAHFHNAVAGEGGGVVQAITFDDSSAGDTWSGFAENIISELVLNRLYFNVHTDDYSNGEIRGQIIFSDEISGPVPVELTSFSASVIDNAVSLSWSTSTENNNSGFEIQRSSDNRNFTAIGFVSGKGTTTDKNTYSFIDKNISSGNYYYRLKQIDYNGSFEFSPVISVNTGIPAAFELSQNYPNPFNPTTKISFNIPEKSTVTLKIFNVLGREVAILLNEEKESGSYDVEFNAANFASGVYFYTLSTSSGDLITKKMTLIK